jgi:hypothetical protein
MPSTGSGQEASSLLKNLIPIRPPDYKSKEALDLFISKANVLSHICLIRAYLPLYHITEPESPGHSLGRILCFKNLSR